MAIAQLNGISDIKKWYLSHLEIDKSLSNQQRNLPLWLLRIMAMNRFKDLDFPDRKNEDWKYTSVNHILQYHFKKAIPEDNKKLKVQKLGYGEMDAYQLVFINGIYDRRLSTKEGLPKGVKMVSIASALKDEEVKDLVIHQLRNEIENAENAFIPLNTLSADSGVLIYLPEGQVLEKPVHLCYINQADKEIPIMVAPKCLVIAEKNSEFTLVESHCASKDNEGVYFSNAVNQIVVKAGAVVNHYKLQNESGQCFQINNTKVFQDKDSSYSHFALDLGGRLVRNNTSIILKSQGSSSQLLGIYLANDKQHIDNQTLVDHACPNCYSNEIYKGIISDHAKGVFNGKVMVRQDAQKTNAFQQNSTLVLSKMASMDTKPQLEIFADDVKCSHGATIGQLDEDSIFYLKTRGLTDKRARALLMNAFLREVVNLSHSDQLSEGIMKLIEEKMNSSDFAGTILAGNNEN